MAKGKLIETIEHEASGLSVEIRQTKSEGHIYFEAEVSGEAINGEVYADVRARVIAVLNALTTPDWMPALVVHTFDHDHAGARWVADSAHLYLGVDRLWLAQRPNGAVFSARWSAYDAATGRDERVRLSHEHDLSRFYKVNYQRKEPVTLALPANGSDARYLPYDAALYQSLTSIIDAITLASASLNVALTTEEGRARLAHLSEVMGLGAVTLAGAPRPTVPANETAHVKPGEPAALEQIDPGQQVSIDHGAHGRIVAEVLPDRDKDSVYLRVIASTDALDAPGRITRRPRTSRVLVTA